MHPFMSMWLGTQLIKCQSVRDDRKTSSIKCSNLLSQTRGYIGQDPMGTMYRLTGSSLDAYSIKHSILVQHSFNSQPVSILISRNLKAKLVTKVEDELLSCRHSLICVCPIKGSRIEHMVIRFSPSLALISLPKHGTDCTCMPHRNRVDSVSCQSLTQLQWSGEQSHSITNRLIRRLEQANADKAPNQTKQMTHNLVLAQLY